MAKGVPAGCSWPGRRPVPCAVPCHRCRRAEHPLAPRRRGKPVGDVDGGVGGEFLQLLVEIATKPCSHVPMPSLDSRCPTPIRRSALRATAHCGRWAGCWLPWACCRRWPALRPSSSEGPSKRGTAWHPVALEPVHAPPGLCIDIVRCTCCLLCVWLCRCSERFCKFVACPAASGCCRLLHMLPLALRPLWLERSRRSGISPR